MAQHREILDEYLGSDDSDGDDESMPFASGAHTLVNVMDSDFRGIPLKTEQLIMQGVKGFKSMFPLMRFQISTVNEPEGRPVDLTD